MTFDDLGLIQPILDALKTEGYTTPTPIQEKSIPLILSGRDLLGVAQTGTGKTAAFSIPMIQILHGQKRAAVGRRPIRSLILTPTRELAIQIGESFENYGKNTDLSSKVIFGGVSQHSQVEALRKGIDVLIATPGRLLDLMNQKFVDLTHVQFFVLDEADRMLDMGFVNDVKKVIAKLPSKRQSLFFSATMPSAIVDLSHKILTNPAKVEVTPVSSTAQMISQSVYFVDKHNKKELLKEILKDITIERVLVFTRTKHGADKVVRELDIARIPARAIHGNKSQNNRQAALTGFKNKEIRVLVATDIAARGIDIDELTHVINFELPNVSESYVHRIGRTGRAGASGIAIAFCDAEEKEYLRDIEKLIAKKIPVIDDHAYPLMNHDIIKSPQPQRGGRNLQPQKTFTRPERNESSRFDRPKAGGIPVQSLASKKYEKKDSSYVEKSEQKSGERISWGKVTKRSEKSFSKNKEAGFYNKNVSESSDKKGGEKTFIKNIEKPLERKGSEKEFPKRSWKKDETTKKKVPKNPKPFQKSLPKGAVIYKGKGDN